MLRGHELRDQTNVRNKSNRQGDSPEEQGQTKSTFSFTKLLSEIKIHKTLHHKHVVEFDSVFEDSRNVYIILELCTNKTLSEMVKKRKKLTVKEARFFML